MSWQRNSTALMLAVCLVALLILWHTLSNGPSIFGGKDWDVTEEGLLEYRAVTPHFNISPPEIEGNSTISQVRFGSRDAEISAILRIPRLRNAENMATSGVQSIPGIVLLPGASVTKEAEQGFARRLADLGYASITLDQRDLGRIDPQADLQVFLQGEEPAMHKMVYDALAAAEILRSLPEIDAERIVYAGESNGGRFAIIACALDKDARGVVAISTCGYGTASVIASASGSVNEGAARFYLSIDPDSYLTKIAPRPLVMIHSKNDTIIPYSLAEQTYVLAAMPKSLHTVGCQTHGYCPEMDDAIAQELERMA
ncbi:MAG: alpha/beta hydrolase [Methanothrix sp.]